MATRRKRIIPMRGEVYLVNFDPTVGAEIKKTRPALILQNNIANRYSPVTIVVAISSYHNELMYPTEVALEPFDGGMRQTSVVLCNQIRTIDTQRLVKKLGVLNPEIMGRVDRAVEISLGLVHI